ncbi:MAG: hypothetical protein KKD90_02600 [Candidatus Omnitrophica bacterium]|nr:hypothetical protein [Candidatus Omnitrophota bacterium]MBU4149492.1 hypothetical protein [Candidatus Omnitrophota bacterium]
MMNKKITRKQFFKAGFLGIMAIIAMPLLRLFNPRPDISRKDARYYKNLAG